MWFSCDQSNHVSKGAVWLSENSWGFFWRDWKFGLFLHIIFCERTFSHKKEMSCGTRLWLPDVFLHAVDLVRYFFPRTPKILHMMYFQKVQEVSDWFSFASSDGTSPSDGVSGYITLNCIGAVIRKNCIRAIPRAKKNANSDHCVYPDSR
jgi:hypothetical protein